MTRRILSACLLTISLVLFLGTATAWIRSCFIEDVISWSVLWHKNGAAPGGVTWNYSYFTISTTRGGGGGLRFRIMRLSLFYRRDDDHDIELLKIQPEYNGRGVHFNHQAVSFSDGSTGFDEFNYNPSISITGFGYSRVIHANPTGASTTQSVAIPDYAILPLTLVLPILRLRTWRRKSRRVKEGRCVRCGYDLRAHAPGSKCPECGRVLLSVQAKV